MPGGHPGRNRIDKKKQGGMINLLVPWLFVIKQGNQSYLKKIFDKAGNKKPGKVIGFGNGTDSLSRAFHKHVKRERSQ